jgi:hypothetical protein
MPLLEQIVGLLEMPRARVLCLIPRLVPLQTTYRYYSSKLFMGRAVNAD